jgi:endonuclease YncB( thermonuclease family)
VTAWRAWACATIALALAAAGLVAPVVAATTTINGKVVRVLDGDSLIVRASRRDVEVRLAEIDTPEKGQPYADNSRKALQGMVLNRSVRLEVLERDRYGRSVSRVYRLPDGTWINAELVRRGYAWVYRRYVRDKSLYAIEKEARKKRAGLWALPEAEREPPWRWRREHPSVHADRAAAPP